MVLGTEDYEDWESYSEEENTTKVVPIKRPIQEEKHDKKSKKPKDTAQKSLLSFFGKK
jgi:hypothetical protein